MPIICGVVATASGVRCHDNVIMSLLSIGYNVMYYMLLYKVDAFTFPNRSLQRTGQASAWNGYITRLRPSLQKAHNMHIISISIHAVQMA